MRRRDAQELCVTSSIFQMPKRTMQAEPTQSEEACHEVGGRPRPPIEGRLQSTDLPRVCMGSFELVYAAFQHHVQIHKSKWCIDIIVTLLIK